MSTHPFLRDEFHIRWSQLTPDHVKADIELAIVEARENLAAICAVTPEKATWENTFGAFDEACSTLNRGWGRLNHLDSVCNSDAQREALNQMLPIVTEFSASIPLNGALWKVFKEFAESPAATQLDPVQQRFIEETCHDFRNAGADLPPEKKKRMTEIEAALSEVTQKFSENVLDSTNAWELIIDDENELAGLPTSAKSAALADAIAKGIATEENPQWRFTLQYPSMGPVLQHADSDFLRRRVYEGSCSIGHHAPYDNSELIWQILSLRQEKASLLGFNNFADLVLQSRMAKNGETALQFGDNLHQRIVEAFQKEGRELQDYKAHQTNAPSAPLEPWETGYWAEKQRKELYDFDDEDLRPYFSVTRVMEGLFGLATRLFGITIQEKDSVFLEPGSSKEANNMEVWDPEVTFYELHDQESGEHLGSFYADWHPRENKRGGAWMNYLQTGLPPLPGQTRQPHLGLICGNMTKPVGDQPALLTHAEVETIFHEFGHLLHQLLSEVPIKGLSGVNVAWDFVELPSQIMENFCWDRQALDFFARHHETDEPIPEELFQKMIAARNYRSASAFMRQLAFGKMDLEMHIHLERYQNRDLDDVDAEILSAYRAPLASHPPSMVRRFGHLFSSPTGYAAGYYSYKWAEVLDADAFTRFQKEGVLNSEIGRAFRHCILSKGNSKRPDELYRGFMGRDPELQPLLDRSGLS